MQQYRMCAPAISESAAEIAHCTECGCPTWWVPTRVMFFSAAGAQRIWVWSCESHPAKGPLTAEQVYASSTFREEN